MEPACGVADTDCVTIGHSAFKRDGSTCGFQLRTSNEFVGGPASDTATVTLGALPGAPMVSGYGLISSSDSTKRHYNLIWNDPRGSGPPITDYEGRHRTVGGNYEDWAKLDVTFIN